MAKTIPTTCPQCGHAPVTEVIYGLIRDISPELQADIRAQRKRLGGCVIGPGAPAYGCLACNWTVSLDEA